MFSLILFFFFLILNFLTETPFCQWSWWDLLLYSPGGQMTGIVDVAPLLYHCTLTFYHQTLSRCPSQDTSQGRQCSTDHSTKKTALCWAAIRPSLYFRDFKKHPWGSHCTEAHRAQMPLLQQQHSPPAQTQWAHKGSLYPLAREQRSLPDADSCGNWEMAMGELREYKNRLIKVLPFTDHIELLCWLVSCYSLDKEPKWFSVLTYNH